jgi:hypothetical protein
MSKILVPVASAANKDVEGEIHFIRNDEMGKEIYNNDLETRKLALDILHLIYISTPCGLWDQITEHIKSYDECQSATERIDWANKMFQGRLHYEL